MDNICELLEAVVLWLDRKGTPEVPFVGLAGGGVYNPPAPHIQIGYLLNSGYPSLRVGSKTVNALPKHIFITNIHQGSFTKKMHRNPSWCLFLNVKGERLFQKLRKESVYYSFAWKDQEKERLVNAFKKVTVRCMRHRTGPVSYLKPEPLYDPMRDKSGGLVGQMLVKAAMLELLVILLDEAMTNTKAKSNRLPTAIRKTMDYMRLHFTESDLDLSSIAKAGGLSIDHFGRAFREATGETPMRFLKHTRIQQARYLLERTELRINEIAYDVGFQDPLHFSRVFKEISGLSPLQYRTKRRNAERK